MNEYKHGNLYIGNIKIKNEIVKENAMLIYDKNKNIFYGIEVLNHLIDIETNKNMSIELKEKILNDINKHTFSYSSSRNDSIPYIEQESIKLFNQSNNKRKNK